MIVLSLKRPLVSFVNSDIDIVVVGLTLRIVVMLSIMLSLFLSYTD